MNEKLAVPEALVVCGRCGGGIMGGWEDGWPLHGRIELGFPSQIFHSLAGGSGFLAGDAEFQAWKVGHPACVDNSAQRVVFEWSEGHEWRLCSKCQDALLRIVGEFFRYGKP